jgi:hypothetical protein
MSPEHLAIFNSPEYQDNLRQRQEASDAKDWKRCAELFFEQNRFGLPKDDMLNQLYNGSQFLTGGAGEAKQEIEKNTRLLAAEYELDDLMNGQDFPGQSSLAAGAIREFVRSLEVRYPGTFESAVDFVRDYIELNKELYKANPEAF